MEKVNLCARNPNRFLSCGPLQSLYYTSNHCDALTWGQREEYFTDLFDQRPFFMELLMELLYQERGSGKNESSAFPNRGVVQEELRKAQE